MKIQTNSAFLVMVAEEWNFNAYFDIVLIFSVWMVAYACLFCSSV